MGGRARKEGGPRHPGLGVCRTQKAYETRPDPLRQDGKGEAAGELGASQWPGGPATGVCARASAAWREGGEEAGGIGELELTTWRLSA